MVTITISGENAKEALKELHGFFPTHDTATHTITLGDVQMPEKALKREKKEPSPLTPPDEKTSPSPTTPYSAVQEIVPKVLKVVKREEVIKMFAQFDGAKSARDLKPEQYQDFIELAEKTIKAAGKI